MLKAENEAAKKKKKKIEAVRDVRALWGPGRGGGRGQSRDRKEGGRIDRPSKLDRDRGARFVDRVPWWTVSHFPRRERTDPTWKRRAGLWAW